MNLVKALDALYPPSPAEWVAAMNAVGAEVGFVYVWPWKTYTAAHVEAAIAAGKRVVPIIVPGNVPPPPPLFAAAWPYGIKGGTIVYDIARGDGQPTPAWIAQAVAECEAAAPAWTPVLYLQPSIEGEYPAAKRWLAIPGAEPNSLPDGAMAVQFGYDVIINGHTYDVSVVDVDQLVPSPLAPQPAPVPAPAPTPPVPTPAPANEEFTLAHPVVGYFTAADAAAGHASAHPSSIVPAGTYRVFNRADGMVNITRVPGVPGWWINPAGSGEVPTSPPAPAPGQSFTVTHWMPGYVTAADAAARHNVRAQVPPGTYHVFNHADGCIALAHLSAPSVALFWINPAH